MEIWKDIDGYDGFYQVSNLGNVRSSKTKQNIYYSDTNKGYFRVNLYKNKKRKSYSIHRLVAEYFLDNPNNYPCVNHKDCNKKNNRVDNLEWCTYKYNNNYKGHNIKKYVSMAIYYLKKEYPNEKEILELLNEAKEKITF